jgi:hypothetical protein
MQAVSLVAKNRKMMATASFMTPSRWYWAHVPARLAEPAADPPGDSDPFNPLALQTGGDVEGPVGRIGSQPILPTATSPPTSARAPTRSASPRLRTSDLFLWEGSMRTRVITEILSGTLQVRLQVYNYAAFMADRRPESISVISGTGLIAPSGF